VTSGRDKGICIRALRFWTCHLQFTIYYCTHAGPAVEQRLHRKS
jgi:hypothetical protein